MSKCANNKCNKDPLNSIYSICVTIDGDFVCDEHCKKEYEKQKNDFFNNIGDDNWYNNWITE